MKKYLLIGLSIILIGYGGNAIAEDMTVTLKDSSTGSGFSVKDSNGNVIARFRGDGYVGIGTTEPGNRFVVKDGKLTFGTSGGGYIHLSNSDSLGRPAVVFHNDSVQGGGELAFHGSASSANWGGNYVNRFVMVSNDKANGIGMVSYDDILFAAGSDGYNDIRVKIDNSGNVGIGTTNPTEKLYVSGNITATGSISQGSSRDLKEDISEISTDEAMKTLQYLSPIKYKYKADETKEEHLGFIAEDVPELVAAKDRKRLNPMDISALLTKVVQEQQRMIQEQQKTIESMMQKIQQLNTALSNPGKIM